MLETTDITKFKNRPYTSIRVLATLEAKEGHGKELINILLSLVGPTRREDGNIAYVPHYAIDNPDKILFDELWNSQKDLDDHFNQPHMKDLIQRMDPLLSQPLFLEIYREIQNER